MHEQTKPKRLIQFKCPQPKMLPQQQDPTLVRTEEKIVWVALICVDDLLVGLRIEMKGVGYMMSVWTARTVEKERREKKEKRECWVKAKTTPFFFFCICALTTGHLFHPSSTFIYSFICLSSNSIHPNRFLDDEMRELWVSGLLLFYFILFFYQFPACKLRLATWDFIYVVKLAMTKG